MDDLTTLATTLPPLAEAGLVLADKVVAVREFLRAAALAVGSSNVAVAWTGGKDSTLALWLWRGVLAELDPGARARAISLDTGCKFPEIVSFREALAKAWDIDLLVARPSVDLEGYPLAVDKVACCRDLKILPLAAALRSTGTFALITGVRADEHASRASRPAVESLLDPPHLRLAPLLHFRELDVWAAIIEHDLPRCPLYARGYRSLGCMPCTAAPGTGTAERAGRDQDKESQLGVLHSLGYF